MSPPKAALIVEQAGRVCERLGTGAAGRVEAMNWALQLATAPGAYAEFDRLVGMYVRREKDAIETQEPPPPPRKRHKQ